MPARSVVIERFTKYGGAGRATLTSGEYLQLTGRAGRRSLDEEGHAIVVWSSETTFAEAARVASAPPPDLRSAFRPSYNLVVNLASRFDRETAHEVLHRSFAQWQAQRPDLLSIQFDHRAAVLDELGYLDWTGTLTDAGHRLSRIYHESDLLVAEALAADIFEDAEPAVLAGVRLCRGLRAPPGPAPGRFDLGSSSGPGPAGAGPGAQRRPPRKKSPLADRLGDKRTAELRIRCSRWRRWPSTCGSPRSTTWCHVPASPRAGCPPPSPRGPVAPPSRPLWAWPPEMWASWPRATSSAP